MTLNTQQIDNFKNQFETLLISIINGAIESPKNITDRVKTFDDALTIIGGPSENFKILMSYNGFDPFMNGAIAMAKLNIIADALNEGWKPDWTNASEYKWYPYFKKAGSGLSFHVADDWRTGTVVGSRLCFKSRELAEYAANQFKDIYSQFMAL